MTLVPASLTARLMDSLWRALAYCLHPRVIGLSLLPLLLCMGVLGGLAFWGWTDAVAQMAAWLNNWSISQTLLGWLDDIGFSGFRLVLAPMLLVILVVPVVVVICLLVVATLMTPAMAKLVVARRFAGLQSRHRSSWVASLGWSLGATVAALAALLVTLPLWLVPPFALLVPPLIWGWLTYRVMAFDTLAEHATAQERQALLKVHRPALLAMGVITGYLGAAPTALWALGALTVVLAPLMLVASIWIYTMVFAFSGLWFAHYLLSALQALRQDEALAQDQARAHAEAALQAAREAGQIIDMPASPAPPPSFPSFPSH